MTKKIPLPGYGIAIIDTSTMEHVDFAGEDKFDLPQSGELIRIRDDEHQTNIGDTKMVYGDLLGKRIFWKKYAEADGLFLDKDLGKDIIFIALDKIMGYEDL